MCQQRNVNFWPCEVADLAGDQPFYIFEVFEMFPISGNEFEVVVVVVAGVVIVVVVHLVIPRHDD